MLLIALVTVQRFSFVLNVLMRMIKGFREAVFEGVKTVKSEKNN